MHIKICIYIYIYINIYMCVCVVVHVYFVCMHICACVFKSEQTNHVYYDVKQNLPQRAMHNILCVSRS